MYQSRVFFIAHILWPPFGWSGVTKNTCLSGGDRIGGGFLTTATGPKWYCNRNDYVARLHTKTRVPPAHLLASAPTGDGRIEPLKTERVARFVRSPGYTPTVLCQNDIKKETSADRMHDHDTHILQVAEASLRPEVGVCGLARRSSRFVRKGRGVRERQI